MDPAPFPPPSPVPVEPPTAALERSLKSQQLLLHTILVVLLVVLTTTTLALFHQIRWLASQAHQLRNTAVELSRFVGDYETNVVPQLTRMVTEFRRFAEANPEYGRAFAKYRFPGEVPGVTNAAAAPKPR